MSLGGSKVLPPSLLHHYGQVTRNSQFHIVIETLLHSCHLAVQSLIHQELLFAVKVQYWCSMMCIASSAGYKYWCCSHFLHFHTDDSIQSKVSNLKFTTEPVFHFFQLLSLYVLVQFYTNLRRWVYVLSSSGIQSKSNWAVVLTLFIQCTNLQNAVYTQNKDSLPYFSASWTQQELSLFLSEWSDNFNERTLNKLSFVHLSMSLTDIFWNQSRVTMIKYRRLDGKGSECRFWHCGYMLHKY